MSERNQRRDHKWAMIGYKGGVCIRCQKAVTALNMQAFHFDHKIPVDNGYDGNDRWSYMRERSPFTDEWFAWAETVDLICERCHINKHRGQLTFDGFLAVQQRLDEYEARGRTFSSSQSDAIQTDHQGKSDRVVPFMRVRTS